ncbi:transposase [Streptacidiphilus sp. EB103A]|uniref:transposase n=1 Tax=Streptacidiphilus sp. EB103A TaxID=3156275 RepID=UPI0035115D2A
MTNGTEIAEGAVPGAGDAGLEVLDRDLVGQLVAQARAGGMKLSGEGSLLAELTWRVLESALEGELADHLGRGRHEVTTGDQVPNHRNGHRSKTVTTEVGPDAREISAHPREIYGTEVSKQTISTITGSVSAGMVEWQNRPLDVADVASQDDAKPYRWAFSRSCACWARRARAIVASSASRVLMRSVMWDESFSRSWAIRSSADRELSKLGESTQGSSSRMVRLESPAV